MAGVYFFSCAFLLNFVELGKFRSQRTVLVGARVFAARLLADGNQLVPPLVNDKKLPPRFQLFDEYRVLAVRCPFDLRDVDIFVPKGWETQPKQCRHLAPC